MSTRVLIVEDNYATREALALLLQTGGYTTAEAANGREALALLLQAAGYTTAEAEDGRSALTYLHSHPAPRLILLDLMMPVMNGWEFLRERRNDPLMAEVPVVLFTAAGGLDAPAVWALGANDVIHKPASPDDLLATAGRYC